MFAGRVKNCKSLVLQDKSNIELFLSPDTLMKADQLVSSRTTQFYIHHASSDKSNHGIIGLSENKTIA